MNRDSLHRCFPILIISFLTALVLLQGCGNKERADGPASGISDRNYGEDEWHHYGNDPGGMRFSPLDQINTDNVSNLEVAWKYETGELDLGLEEGEFQASFSATPLVVEGVMYFTTPSSRVIALDAETGREIWTFDPQEGRENREFNSNRGVAWWNGEGSDGSKQKRILFGTVDSRFYSLNAETGLPDYAFGQQGYIDLRKGEADMWSFAAAPTWGARVTSPPVVYGHIVITGWGLPEYPSEGPGGDVRAYDIRTGELIWRFHTVPHDGEFGDSTWENESRDNRMGANVWSMMSVDRERGLVFLPTGSAAYDFYGGDRKGENLFSNSLVAIDALTGEMQWHYQMVHHDIWDYDVPSQPNLITLTREGEEIPAVAQTTKMGFVFVFDRLTGEPLFPVEQREVHPVMFREKRPGRSNRFPSCRRRFHARACPKAK